MKLMYTLLSMLVCVCTAAQSFELSSLFSDGMVVQRDVDLSVWGWAEAGAKVTVAPSWAQKTSARADAEGCWRVVLPSPESIGPHTMRVSAVEPSQGRSEKVITDIVAGEVWICGGQSNMEMPVRGWGEQYIEGSGEALLEAPEYSDRIRVFHILADTTSVPQKNVEAQWKHTDMATAGSTSALAYFFARLLTSMLDVPVGIIVNPWGGSRIQTWMPYADVEAAIRDHVTSERLTFILDRKQERDWCPDVTAACYNSRFHPIAGYPAKGFLWYQGETDRADYDIYDELLTAFAARLRVDWGDDDASMPFMFVTMAPWEDRNCPVQTMRPRLVEAQLSCLRSIPNSYAAVTETYGSAQMIHPSNKRGIAEQLAFLAYEKAYGMETGVSVGFPYPYRIEFPAETYQTKAAIRLAAGYPTDITVSEGHRGSVYVAMKNCNSGLGDHNSPEIKGFEVAGEDRVFHPAEAIVFNGHWLKVWSDDVPEPVAMRYAFRNYSDANLKSAFGIPVPSFRSDDWNED